MTTDEWADWDAAERNDQLSAYVAEYGPDIDEERHQQTNTNPNDRPDNRPEATVDNRRAVTNSRPSSRPGDRSTQTSDRLNSRSEYANKRPSDRFNDRLVSTATESRRSPVTITIVLSDGSPLTTAGEPVGDHLAIDPAINTTDGITSSFTGRWTVTHIPTGLAIHGDLVCCLDHARAAARVLAGADVDWSTTDVDHLTTDPTTAAAVNHALQVAYHCDDAGATTDHDDLYHCWRRWAA